MGNVCNVGLETNLFFCVAQLWFVGDVLNIQYVVPQNLAFYMLTFIFFFLIEPS